MNNIEDLLFFSGKDNYLRVSKGLVRTLGVECAFLFAELVDEFLYYYENKYNSLHENDYWFYSTADNIKERTGWSADKQDRILKELETHGLIIKKVMGIPAKRHFKLCVEKARKLVVDYHETTFRKKRKLDTVENGNLSSEITETNIRNSNQGTLTRNFNSKEKINKKEIPTTKKSLTTQKQYDKDFEDFYEAFEGVHPSKQPKRAEKIFPKWKNACKTHTEAQILCSVRKYAEYLQKATWRKKKDIIAWLNGAMYEVDWEMEKLQEQPQSNKTTFNNQNANTKSLRDALNENKENIRNINPFDYL